MLRALFLLQNETFESHWIFKFQMSFFHATSALLSNLSYSPQTGCYSVLGSLSVHRFLQFMNCSSSASNCFSLKDCSSISSWLRDLSYIFVSFGLFIAFGSLSAYSSILGCFSLGMFTTYGLLISILSGYSSVLGRLFVSNYFVTLCLFVSYKLCWKFAIFQFLVIRKMLCY